jgi:hypothetical protein
MMRVITRRCFPTLFAAAAATLGAGCAPLLISTSVDRGVDLSAYRTYGWSSQAAAATGDPRLDGNPFFHGYLAASIDKRLIATGLVRQGGEPDLLVRYFPAWRNRSRQATLSCPTTAVSRAAIAGSRSTTPARSSSTLSTRGRALSSGADGSKAMSTASSTIRE